MTPKPASSKIAVLVQIRKLIPAALVARLAAAHGVDKKARAFSPFSHVVALLLAQLTRASSLNDVCDNARLHQTKLNAQGALDGGRPLQVALDDRGLLQTDQTDVAVVRLSGSLQERDPVADLDGAVDLPAAAFSGLESRLVAQLQPNRGDGARDVVEPAGLAQAAGILWDNRWRLSLDRWSGAIVFAWNRAAGDKKGGSSYGIAGGHKLMESRVIEGKC